MASPTQVPTAYAAPPWATESTRRVKALVMEHTLAPRDRVNIDAVARELEVSPTPLREALARLESDGLVRKRPLAGYTVSPLLTRQEFTDMFDMRLVLEGSAARWAAERADRRRARRDRGRVGGRRADLDEPGQDGRGSHAAFTALDARFHDLIADAAGNPLLSDGDRPAARAPAHPPALLPLRADRHDQRGAPRDRGRDPRRRPGRRRGRDAHPPDPRPQPPPAGVRLTGVTCGSRCSSRASTTCLYPQTGIAVTRVLERLGHTRRVPGRPDVLRSDARQQRVRARWRSR